MEVTTYGCLSVFCTAIGAFFVHKFPDFAPHILAVVACLTHHSGKASNVSSHGE